LRASLTANKWKQNHGTTLRLHQQKRAVRQQRKPREQQDAASLSAKPAGDLPLQQYTKTHGAAASYDFNDPHDRTQERPQCLPARHQPKQAEPRGPATASPDRPYDKAPERLNKPSK